MISYSVSSVPILQYGISSATLSEQEIFDVALNQIRVGLISVPGVAVPLPFGGKQRVVSVDIDLPALQAKNLSPQDVVNAVNVQNFVYPSGTAKIGTKEHPIDVNTTPRVIDHLNAAQRDEGWVRLHLDPFIILTALTGALAGVLWGLYLSATTLSVPAMMGTIMCLGVATANSVLVVTFARANLEQSYHAGGKRQPRRQTRASWRFHRSRWYRPFRDKPRKEARCRRKSLLRLKRPFSRGWTAI